MHNMVIDCHCHLWSSDVPSPLWKDSLVDIGVRRSGTERSKVEEYIEDGYFDLSGDMLVEDMDQAGIDKAILNILDFGLRNDERGGTSLNEQHQIYAGAVANHPDRLSFLGGIDPQRPHPGKFVDKAVERWNIQSVKLHPTTGFYPDDSCAYLVYQKCVKHDIPVMIHTGPEIAPFSAKYARPASVFS